MKARENNEKEVTETNPIVAEQEVEKQEPVTELTKEEQLVAELAIEKDKYLRLFAEFDNYKRRTTKERIELFKTASQEVLVAILPIMDDFDRALRAAEASTDSTAIKEGVTLIASKLKNITQKQGLSEMESIGKEFDPELHEAITNIPAPKPNLVGKVIDELEKGYYLNDKVVRHAKVVVGA